MTSTASAWAQLGLVPSSKSTMLTVNSPGKDVQADDHVNHEINGANVYTKKESKLFKTFFGSSTNRANEEAKTPTKAANSDSTSKDNFTSDWKNRINSVKAHLTKTPLKATLTPSKIDLSCERKPILTGRLMGGIRNLGNSCYISSVLQVHISIDVVCTLTTVITDCFSYRLCFPFRNSGEFFLLHFGHKWITL